MAAGSAGDVRVHAERLSRVRGLLLGLAVGDAMATPQPTTDQLRAGVVTQLAAFTVEGMIRARVRSDPKGICHEPTVIWHAYCRWGAQQGVLGDAARRRWAGGDMTWPDGWLATVPALRRRRGSAPATVRALRESTGLPSTDLDPSGSAGAHAMVRSVVLAAFAPWVPAGALVDVADATARSTHQHPVASATAGAGVLVASALLAGRSLAQAAAEVATLDTRLARQLELAVSSATGGGAGDVRLLHRCCPDGRSDSVLRGAVFAAAGVTSPAGVADAIRLAARAQDGADTAAMAGALLGATHGVDALPCADLARLELGWVMEVLARDVVEQMQRRPAGSGWGDETDPHWWDRYPGC